METRIESRNHKSRITNHKSQIFVGVIMRVAEIMSTHVRTVGPADSAELAWDRMRLHRIHHLVVVRDAEILGVITDRDLGGQRGREVREGRSVRDLMTPAVTSASPDTTIREPPMSCGGTAPAVCRWSTRAGSSGSSRCGI
jgi:CBS-domain-containing membrane protein